MARNETYSFKDFTGQSLAHIPVNELTGDIVGSCFSHETPGTIVFPTNMVAVFKRCNLDNCIIPVGCTIESDKGIASSQRRFKVQNDLEDWEINEADEPTEPLSKKYFESLGLSTDPKDIPIEKREGESVTQEKERLLREA